MGKITVDVVQSTVMELNKFLTTDASAPVYNGLAILGAGRTALPFGVIMPGITARFQFSVSDDHGVSSVAATGWGTCVQVNATTFYIEACVPSDVGTYTNQVVITDVSGKVTTATFSYTVDAPFLP
jgi:hypothetical protein